MLMFNYLFFIFHTKNCSSAISIFNIALIHNKRLILIARPSQNITNTIIIFQVKLYWCFSCRCSRFILIIFSVLLKDTIIFPIIINISLDNKGNSFIFFVFIKLKLVDIFFHLHFIFSHETFFLC